MSNLRPLREDVMGNGQGGYGYEGNLRSQRAEASRAKLPQVAQGRELLTYKELQRLLAKVVLT